MGELIEFVKRKTGRQDTGPRSEHCEVGLHLRCSGGWDDEGCGCKCHTMRTIKQEVGE